MVLLELAAVILLADFVSGLVHWWQDRYARLDGPAWQRGIALNNLRHHARPRELLGHSYLESSWELLLGSAVIVAIAAVAGLLTWHVIVFALLSSQANQLHKWAHRTPQENGPIIGSLQRLHLLQTPRHHGRHHQGARDTHYCVITNFLNPLLEEVRFWRRLETMVARLGGGAPRDETAGLRDLGLLRSTPPDFAVRLTKAVPTVVWHARPALTSASAV